MTLWLAWRVFYFTMKKYISERFDRERPTQLCWQYDHLRLQKEEEKRRKDVEVDRMPKNCVGTKAL